MNGLRKLSLMAAMLVCTTLAAVAQKPNIHILATGGTIAGTGASATKTNYTAGQVAISTLLEAVPESEQNSQCDRGTDCKNRLSGHE